MLLKDCGLWFAAPELEKSFVETCFMAWEAATQRSMCDRVTDNDVY